MISPHHFLGCRAKRNSDKTNKQLVYSIHDLRWQNLWVHWECDIVYEWGTLTMIAVCLLRPKYQSACRKRAIQNTTPSDLYQLFMIGFATIPNNQVV